MHAREADVSRLSTALSPAPEAVSGAAPAASVTVPIRRAPGWRAARSEAASPACCSGTIAANPQPMLKTSHISDAGTSPSRATRVQIPGDGSGSSIA
jgi:hypothetical protein